MMNLLLVRPHAEYENPALIDCTGSEALARDTSGFAEVGEDVRAKPVWSGGAIQMLKRPSDKTWGMVA